MSSSVLALLLVITSASLLPVAGRALWTASAHRDWDATSTLVFFAGLAGGLPTALSNLVRPREQTYSAFGVVEVGLTGWAAQLERAGTVALLAGAVLFFLLRFQRQRYVLAPCIALAVVLVGAFSDVAHANVAALGPRQLTLLGLLLAAVVARPGRSAYLGAAAVGVLFALLGGLQALLHPNGAFRACRPDKCGPAGVLYAGASTNENTFGLLLALTVVFVWLAVRGRPRVLLALFLGASVWLTGSRTAQQAVLAAVVVLLVLRPTLPDGPGRPRSADHPGRRGLAVTAVVAAALVGMVLPLLPRVPTSLTDRAYFWQLARAGIGGSPLFGLGSTAWEQLYQVGRIPIAGTYSVHNQWLDVTYAAGLIGLVLFVSLVLYLLLRAGPTLTVVAALLTHSSSRRGPNGRGRSGSTTE